MATEMVRQTMFTTGEVDVVNFKRTDLAEYLTCAQSLLNAEVGTTGLAKKRKGTKFLINIDDFVDVNSQGYEFVDKNNNYYFVLSGDEEFNVFSIDSTTGAMALVTTMPLTTPYTSADLLNIDYSLDNDVLILTHPLYPTARIYISDYGTTPVTFAYQALNIFPLPAFDFGTIDYNAFVVSLSASGSVLTFEFTTVGADPGFNSDWVGGQIIGGGATPEQPIGYALITAASYSAAGGGTVTFTADIIIPFETTTYATFGSQYSIRQPAFSATKGYPAKVIFYQNRLWLANTITLPNTVFGSKINAPLNFDVGTGADTDAIIYTIGQTNTGGINWLNGGKQLEIYCQNYEFAAPQEPNLALTPSTFSIRQQSAYGSSANIKPITYINDSYYVSRTGTAIINFHFDGIGQTYTSSNISVGATHLVTNPINRALVRGTDVSQDNFIYFLNPDSSVTAFQFAHEYKLAALTPINFNSEVDEDDNAINPVFVLDTVSINNEVYFIKLYQDTSSYVIEKFVNDVKIDGYISSTMGVSGLVPGLSQFNGYTVQVIFEGQDYGTYQVASGEITVDNPEGLSGAVNVGLLYVFNVTPMYLFAGAEKVNHFKQITRIFVDYYLSLDFFVDGVLVNYQYFADIQAGLPITPKTDTAVIDPVDGWNRFATFSIYQNSPFDCQIVSISYQIDAVII